MTFQYSDGSESLRQECGQFQSLTYVQTTDIGETAALEAVARMTLLNDDDFYQMEQIK
jgi:hypothetical protein